jgi:biotin synthase
MTQISRIAETLTREHQLSDQELKLLIDERDEETALFLEREARQLSREIYGNKIYIRGLIEFTNYCKNDCYYCGIRKGNHNASRYRLGEEEILSCCKAGYELGFRTFVLQGGEDPYFTDERFVKLVSAIRETFPDCAITLSAGERSRESYQKLYEAGADRYLLRHETADSSHYQKLHPEGMILETRMACLQNIREIGFQTGCGFMVGSPGQTTDHIVKDLRFMKEFKPHMIGIGPFLPHKDTPFKDMEGGTAEFTLYLLSIIRLLMPEVLLPATTALGTVKNGGREEGILHGANVVMPNLSPKDVREKYMLYNNKLSSGSEAAESLELLKKSFADIGYEAVVHRGDSLVK